MASGLRQAGSVVVFRATSMMFCQHCGSSGAATGKKIDLGEDGREGPVGSAHEASFAILDGAQKIDQGRAGGRPTSTPGSGTPGWYR